MSKRQKFVFASLLLSLGLLSTQLVTIESYWRYIAILGLFIVSYFVSAWALFDDLKGVEWLVIVPFPGLYATSVALFYFLLPEALLSRIVIFLLFGLGMYALYLTSNIYSVAAIRTIQLLRAAHAVGFLMSLVTGLFFYNTIFSFRWPFFINAVLVFIASFPIVLNGLWSVKLEPYISRQVIMYGLTVSFVLAELAAAISFLPVTVWIASLSLVTGLYVFLGILQHHLQERLFQSTFREYIYMGLVVLVIMMILTPWR
jgi:hypothetical protein